MLVRFSVKNYWCFEERIEIDFTDKRNYGFGTGCVRGDYLEKVVILGCNGSGKTSFGYAITDIVTTVTGFTKDIGQHSEVCFINGSSGSDRAEFRYEFNWHGSLITYEYAKVSPFRVVYERLEVDRDVVFSYDLDRIEDSVINLDQYGIENVRITDLDGSQALMKVIRDGAYQHDSAIGSVIDYAENSLYYRAMWRMDDHIGMMDCDLDLTQFIMENDLVEDLERFLREEGDVDVSLERSNGELTVMAGDRVIPFFQAVSRGTAILSRLYVWMIRCKGRDSLMFFDDFDDLFDYRTAENVMSYIIRGSEAQCMFVTHNVDLVSSDHMRPDCCFIMNRGHLSSLSSLTDKNIRRGHNLAKMIREGEFASAERR